MTGAEAWYIAVVILGSGFLWQKINRDEEIIRDLIRIESDFWNGHVVPRIMPDPDGSDICSEVIAQYYPRSDREAVILPSSFNERLQRREEIRRLAGRLEAEQKQIEQEIKLFMKEKETAVNDQYRITWSDVESQRLDSKRIRQEKPELFQEFSSVSRSRRFQVKAA